MTYGTVNADTLVTSTSGGILGAGNASIMKNRIINGAMVVNQRATTLTDYGYATDRWSYNPTSASKASVAQSSTAPAGFVNSLLTTSTAATTVGTNDIYIVEQKIEGYNIADLGWGTADAKTVTLSFWVRSSLTGAFGGALGNAGPDRSYPFSYTISAANTWEYKTITVAGDTTGTWNTTNGAGIRVIFSVGSGATRSGTANAWTGTSNIVQPTGSTSLLATNGATLYITGVQLEVGSSATGFEYENYTSLLSKCQRYYWTNTGSASIMAIGVGGFPTTSRCDTTTSFPVQMRTIPSVSFTGTPAIDDYYSVSGNVSSVAATYLTQNGGVVVNNMAVSTFVSGRVGRYTLGSGAYAINYSAEL